jgi:hypothetical protein
LAPEIIEPETLRRSTLPGPKPIPPDQWVQEDQLLKVINSMEEKKTLNSLLSTQSMLYILICGTMFPFDWHLT